jgi:hypothetical protein
MTRFFRGVGTSGVLLALTLFPAFAFSQTASDKPDRTTTILNKINRLDMAKYLLPLILEKPQIRAVLTGMDKCKAKEMEIRALDAKLLAPLEERLDKALNGALDKGDYPDKSFMVEVTKATAAIAQRREIATGEMVEIMFDVVNKSLNGGQKKIMSKLIDRTLVDKKFIKEAMAEDDWVKIYIRFILLDATSYSFLNEQYKRMK